MADQLLLSLKERLMLANQYRILEALYPQEAARFALNRQAVEGGFTSQYDSLLINIRADVPPEDCHLVSEVLDLYRAMQQSFRQYRDRHGLNERDIEFPGFDSTTEAPLLDLAQYLIKRSDRPATFQHAYSDSRTPMAARYRRMVVAWAGLGRRPSLTKDELQVILAA